MGGVGDRALSLRQMSSPKLIWGGGEGFDKYLEKRYFNNTHKNMRGTYIQHISILCFIVCGTEKMKLRRFAPKFF